MKRKLKSISRTECVRIKDADSLLIHVSLKFSPHKVKPSRRRGKPERGNKTYVLTVRQGDKKLFCDTWTNVKRFPLQAMKDALAKSAEMVIQENPEQIAKGLKSVRTQLQKAERKGRY